MDKKSDRPVGIYIPRGRRQIEKTKDLQGSKDSESLDIKLIGSTTSVNTNADNISINLNLNKNGNNKNNLSVISSDNDKNVKSNKLLEVTNKIDLDNKLSISDDSVNLISTNNIVPIIKERLIGIYIPKGRRILETQKVSNCFQNDLVDEEQQINNRNKNSSLENTISWIERFEKVDRVSDYTPTVTEVDPICYETSILITDEMILDSCLVISNVSLETSEIVKSNLCLPYQNAGGIIKWIYPNECLIIFKNEKAVLAATSKATSSYNNCTFKIQLLKNSNTLNKDEYIQCKLICILYDSNII